MSGPLDPATGIPLPPPAASTALPATVRVFVDERAVEVARGASVLDAVRAFDGATADAVVAGERLVTDSRGLSADPQAPTHGGAIYRILPARRRVDAGAEPA
jgi:hypothetical protein